MVKSRSEIVEEIHLCLHYKQQGLTRRKISEVITEDHFNLSEAEVKTRLGQARKAWLYNELPDEESQLNFPIEIERPKVIIAEMDRRDVLLENKVSRLTISKEYRDGLTLEALDKCFDAPSRELRLHDAARFRESLLKYNTRSEETEVAIQFISDLHHCRFAAGVMDEATTAKALEKYREKCSHLLARQRTHCNVEKLVMVLGGDLLHGYFNYPNQPREVTGTLSYQIAKTANLIISHIEQEYNQYGSIDVYCLGGNHGRKGPQQDLVMDNAEVDMYRIVEAYFRKVPFITFKIVDDTFYTIADVMGRKYFLTHGDVIRGSGTPQAFLAAVARWQAIFPPFDDVLMGHFHRLTRLPLPTPVTQHVGRSLFVNGTGSIDDTFLQGFGASPSLSWWYIFCDGIRTTATYDVSLYG